MKFLAALFCAMLLLGCAGVQQEQQKVKEGSEQVKNDAAALAPTAAKGDVVSVYYTGKFENGTVFDSNAGGTPLTFTVGAGQMIAGFDAAVVGMKEGQEKAVTIPPEKAYGAWSQENVAEVPLENIGGSENLKVGSELSASNGARGRVVKIEGGKATVDFNHSLAGKTLFFTIRMAKISKKA